MSAESPRSGSLGVQSETSCQSLYHTRLQRLFGGRRDRMQDSLLMDSWASHSLFTFPMLTTWPPSFCTLKNFNRAPVIFQEPLSSENKSLQLGRESKSTIKEAFSCTPIGTAMLTKSGRSSFAFFRSGAASMLSSESTLTNLHLSLFLKNLGAAILNFLGDSLTSMMVHSDQKE